MSEELNQKIEFWMGTIEMVMMEIDPKEKKDLIETFKDILVAENFDDDEINLLIMAVEEGKDEESINEYLPLIRDAITGRLSKTAPKPKKKKDPVGEVGKKPESKTVCTI